VVLCCQIELIGQVADRLIIIFLSSDISGSTKHVTLALYKLFLLSFYFTLHIGTAGWEADAENLPLHYYYTGMVCRTRFQVHVFD